MGWRDVLAKAGVVVEARADALWHGLEARMGGDRVYVIQPYNWFGTVDGLTVRGRVLRHNGLQPPDDDDRFWDNLLNSYRRFNSKEVPHARIEAQVGEHRAELVCDDEGYFEGTIPLDVTRWESIRSKWQVTTRGWRVPGKWWQGSEPKAGWTKVAVRLLDADNAELATTTSMVLIPPTRAQFGVISDIDDTILLTHATNLRKAARVTFLQNAYSRLPFAGVAELYHALQGGKDGQQNNPIFYVSSSPWNLYDLLTDFMALQSIPQGPLLLRDIGIDDSKFIASNHRTHKLEQIERVLNTYPALPFVLIGDSGQKDPEIYAEVAEKYPGRIKAIYIRDVSDEAREDEILGLSKVLNVPFVLMEDSLLAAKHSAEIGLIPDSAIALVAGVL